MWEIGSEFQLNSTSRGHNSFDLDALFSEKRFVLSGRTGLAIIADELKLKFNTRTVALPAYCCSSMVYPFWNKGISIVFYPMPDSFEEAQENDIYAACEVINVADAVLMMDYFGFVRRFALQIATNAWEMGKKIIVDATQTAFSGSSTYSLADYALISYRKWSDLLCAAVYSKECFSSKPPDILFEQYSGTWRKASELKKQFLNCEITDKAEYLHLYEEANHLLSIDYESFRAPDIEVHRLRSVDSESLISKRRQNAAYLMDAIKRVKAENEVELLFDYLDENDCPLFVPILVNAQKRTEIRRQLISRNIYCPVHWPIDTKFPYIQTPYHLREISLICDQRYDIEDMKREVEGLIIALSE